MWFVCVVMCGGDAVSSMLILWILWCDDGCGCWRSDVNVNGWMPYGVEVVMRIVKIVCVLGDVWADGRGIVVVLLWLSVLAREVYWNDQKWYWCWVGYWTCQECWQVLGLGGEVV